MDLYLAGAVTQSKEVRDGVLPHNVLFSYIEKNRGLSNLKDYDLSNYKLFIDSGAFSMWTRGAQVDVDKYIEWINDKADYVSLYAQVDAIPGTKSGNTATLDDIKIAAQKTWDNYLYMRPRMKNPDGLLYTFHVGEPKEFLEQALEWVDEEGKHIPYIALGGMVGKSTQVRRQFLDMCFDVISKSSNPNVKTHSFGMTNQTLLKCYPITSADSTTWIKQAVMGGIMSDYGIIMLSSLRVNEPRHYTHLPQKFREKLETEVCEFGFTLDELSESNTARIIHNARYMKDRISKITYIPKTKIKTLF